MVTYKKLTHINDNDPDNPYGIQVESAIRDGNGAQIDTNYLKKNKLWVFEEELGTTDTGTLTTTLTGIPSGTSPRIIQIFEKGTGTYTLIQTDATLTLSGSDWSYTITKPSGDLVWVVRIFGWADTL